MKLKVILGLDWFFPDSCGGTEVYVLNLAKALQRIGVDVRIVAPSNHEKQYEFQGIPVYRYPFDFEKTFADNQKGFDCFKRWLLKQEAQIYHQHSGGLGHQKFNLEYAKSLKMKTLMTFHIANAVCVKGTMLQYGTEPCDGKIDFQRCASCFMCEKKVPRFFAEFFSRIPLVWSKTIRSMRHRLGFMRAFTGPAFIENHKNKLMSLIPYTDRLIVISEWFNRALQINHIPKEKISLVHSGIDFKYPNEETTFTTKSKNENSLKLLYLGRYTPTKGLEILVKAILKIPSNFEVRLTIHGIVSNNEDQKFKHKIESLVQKNKRIQFAKTLERHEVIKVIQDFDFLVIPSLCFEMYPTVVMEAFAAGIPVIGHAFGGTLELIEHNVNGLLISKPTVEEWRKTILRLAQDPHLKSHLKTYAHKPLSMDHVSKTMLQEYQNILSTSVIQERR